MTSDPEVDSLYAVTQLALMRKHCSLKRSYGNLLSNCGSKNRQMAPGNQLIIHKLMYVEASPLTQDVIF